MQERIYNAALRFLSYRPRSEKEVRDYLARHSGEEERRNGRDSGHGQNNEIESIIEKVIAKLKVQKFLNDEEFVKWWIEQRTTFKPRGLKLIKIELRQKGISQELIELGIMNYESGINDLEQARRLIRKRVKRYKGLQGEEIHQKLGRYLASKGFDWETIKQSIDEVVLKRV